MLTRRGFLKGFLASIAAAALVKNGVVQPEQVVAKPESWTIDMAANTWRREWWTTPIPTWEAYIGYCAMWNRELSAAKTAYLTPIMRNCGAGDLMYVTFDDDPPTVVGRATHIDPIGDQVIVRIRSLGAS